MDAPAITQCLHRGTLPCGWLPDGLWTDVQKHAQAHESARLCKHQHIDQLKQARRVLKQRRQELQIELLDIKTQIGELDAQVKEQEKSLPALPDLSSLLEFATRVVPIEQDLVGKLQAELDKKKEAQLAALDDDTSTKPKLSLMLNCMGIDTQGIAATRALDLAQFIRKTRRPA